MLQPLEMFESHMNSLQTKKPEVQGSLPSIRLLGPLLYPHVDLSEKTELTFFAITSFSSNVTELDKYAKNPWA